MCNNCSIEMCEDCFQRYLAERQGGMDNTLDTLGELRYTPNSKEDVCYFIPIREEPMDLKSVPEITQEYIAIAKNPEMEKHMDDLEYVRNKLFAALGIPAEYIAPMPPKVEVKVCECGGEKLGLTHSSWCPKG